MTEALAAQPELVAGTAHRQRRLIGSVGSVLAAVWLVLLVGSALLADVLPLYDPLAVDPSSAFAAPGAEHWLGADQLGRDQLAQLVHGARISLTVGVVASVLAAVVGGSVGLVAGYFGRHVESAIMGVVDILLAFPALILALSLTAFLGAGVGNVITAIAVLSVPAFARVTRATTKSLVNRDFVQAARVLGASHRRILVGELAPNVFPTVLAYVLVTVAIAMVVEGALSFLGLGVPPPDPTWGTMIAANKGQLATEPYLALVPAAVLLLTVLALNVLGERLQGRAAPVTAPTTAPLTGPRPVGPLLVGTDVRTSFDTPSGVVHAVRGVDLEVAAGETLGIVGESGSGKSVLVRSLMGIQAGQRGARCSGSVVFDGTELTALSPARRRAFWGSRIAIVFQNPMTALNPVVRIGRQLTEVVRLHTGADRAAARAQAAELLDQVGIPDPARRLREYPHQLSGGMRQRVAIAIALAGAPDLLIADEPTTALDVTVQAAILALLKRLQDERGMALLLVTHDLGVVAGSCDRVAVMYAGRLVETGPTADVVARPAMPYTEALIASTPRLENPPKSLLPAIGGRPPSPRRVEPGCPFAPRCGYATDRCRAEQPALTARADDVDGSYACWHPRAGLPATSVPATSGPATSGEAT